MSYFKPLRRQLGIVTLLIACLLVGGWVRSMLVGDFLTRSNMEFISINQALIIRFAGKDSPATTAYESAVLDRAGNGLGYDDDWDSLHFGFGYRSFPVTRFLNGSRSESTTVDYRIPYCSIALPMVALSAYLLLSKTRVRVRTSPNVGGERR